MEASHDTEEQQIHLVIATMLGTITVLIVLIVGLSLGIHLTRTRQIDFSGNLPHIIENGLYRRRTQYHVDLEWEIPWEK
jgi:hypothetical protein